MVRPDGQNDPVRRVLTKLYYGLGEQDISSSLKTSPTLTVAENAYYAVAGYDAVVDPNLEVAGRGPWAWWANPSGPQDIPDDAAWTNVGDTITITAGPSEVWLILGTAQMFGWKGLTGATPSDASEHPYRTQIAISVDGVVEERTVTGQVWPDPPVKELYKVKASSPTKDWDWRALRRTQNGWGLSNHAQPCRVSFVTEISPGTHTVRFVGRRLPRHDGEVDNGGVGSTVKVHNRQMYVIRLKGGGYGGRGEPDLPDVTMLQEGGTWSTADHNTQMGAVVGYINALPGEAVRTGALREQHLQSKVTYRGIATINNVYTAQPSTVYSSFSGYPGAGSIVTDSVGGKLQLNPGVVFSNLGHGVFIVQGNLHVHWIYDNAGKSDQAIAVFKLSYRNNTGTVKVVQVATQYLTPRNEVPVGEGGGNCMSPQVSSVQQVPCEDDVPFLWVVDTAELVAADADDDKIDYIQVTCETHAGAAAGIGTIEVWTGTGSLAATLLTGVTIG